ncbi:MAG: isopentenyl phosphate kinase family protein [Anaerolineales bacterium]|nr:isopentenyl phosphate kinase family protein [Chloroflexota bacterium]MBL7161317.1 isopentenyl phosphate kinase family protein [Anaerolineales bacterium]
MSNPQLPIRRRHLQFLKLGGSLITDKTTPRTPRRDVIARLAQEIKSALAESENLRLVLGHGSGSFGHVPAKKYGTRLGVDSAEGWRGFAKVWYEASLLNRIVMDVLHESELPAVAFPPSGAVTASNGQVTNWNLSPLRAALEAGIIPVVFGDTVFDEILGGTILSTEDLFTYLARELYPQRISLAGIDEGVWADYPQCTQLIPEITPENWAQVDSALQGSASADVTGGMASKVRQMLDIVEQLPDLEVLIFSGNHPENVRKATEGNPLGTKLLYRHQTRV